jgi:hypothetical protein
MNTLSTGSSDLKGGLPWASVYRRWLFSVAIILGLLPLWNIALDPYGIFRYCLGYHSAFTSPSTNERILKVQHLIDLNKGAGRKLPNAFIVGSSVMGVVDPDIVESHVPGSRFYNLSFLAATPKEIKQNLVVLANHHIPIKHIVYGIDPIAFSDYQGCGFACRLHPKVDGNSFSDIALDALMAPSLMDGFSRLLDIFNDRPSVVYDIKGGGRYFLPNYDHAIAVNHALFIESRFKNQPLPKAPPWIEGRFGDFQDLIRWCASQHIELTLYINPLQKALIDAYSEIRLHQFEQRIRRIAADNPVNNCTKLLSNAASDRPFFYDFKHFRPEFSRQVMACAFSTPKI